jgi:hypothetical protein
VPGVAKRSLHRAPHRGIVLDQEDVHRSSLGRRA